MLHRMSPTRRGITLTETLVSFIIMTLGVMSVITLFPVGISQIRQSVNDTRSTLLALNAKPYVAARDLPNDPYLLQLPVVTPLVTSKRKYNAYTTILSADAKTAVTQFPTTAAAGEGFPVYVDPILANAIEFQTGNVIKRIEIRSSTFSTAISPFNTGTNAHDIPIHTVDDMLRLVQADALAVSTGGVACRADAYLHHWFFSESDISFDVSNPTIPLDPRAKGIGAASENVANPPVAFEFIQSRQQTPSPLATAARDPQFSWSFVVTRRNITPDNPSGTSTYTDVKESASAVSANSGWNASDIKILVFFRRNLAAPYQIVRGCFFNGSRMATISWPNTSPTPAVRAGTYLMEATISGGSRTPTGGIQRQAINFHRIAAVDTPILTGGEFVQTVTLENPVSDPEPGGATAGFERLPYPVGGAGTDNRVLPDDYSAPVNTFPYATPTTPIANGTILWLPVVIWDGLIEVF